MKLITQVVTILSSGVVFSSLAQDIDVSLSSTTSGASIVTTENAPFTIADAPGENYDAANTSDSGTTWNSLICPTVTFNNTSGGQVTNIVEQNLSLVNSADVASSVSISSIQFSENNGKNDTIHQSGIAGSNPGTDGLSSDPTGLMNQSWFNNGTSEFMIFNLTGLTAGYSYNLLIYGAGQALNYGGTFTVPTANKGSGYNSATGAYTTEPTTGAMYRSVFDSTGDNPTPEKGLSWTELPVVADSSGDLSFQVMKDNGTGIKGSINGFQLEPIGPAPEPSDLALAGAGLGLLGLVRFRRRS